MEKQPYLEVTKHDKSVHLSPIINEGHLVHQNNLSIPEKRSRIKRVELTEDEVNSYRSEDPSYNPISSQVETAEELFVNPKLEQLAKQNENLFKHNSDLEKHNENLESQNVAQQDEIDILKAQLAEANAKLEAKTGEYADPKVKSGEGKEAKAQRK